MTAAVATRPRWLPVDLAGIHPGLCEGSDFYVWRAESRPGQPGKWNKRPRLAKDHGEGRVGDLAEWSDPSTGVSVTEAFMVYQADPTLDGIGRVLRGGGITGIDLDDAFAEDGSLKPHARQIVDALPGAYWERSPSRTGLRGFCRAHLPPGRRKRRINGCSVELYDDVRFLTMTGAVL